MQYGIITGSRAPLRAEKSGASEMVSELLFGEAIEIVETENTWVKVRNLFDSYEGWMDIRLLEIVQGFSKEQLLQGKLVQNIILPIYRLDPQYGMKVQLLGMNCFFPDCFQIESGEESAQYRIGTQEFFAGSDSIGATKEFTRDNLIEIAEWYANTPYLWGGRSSAGIDCSGLVQQAFRACGQALPRDAKDQALKGKKIAFEEIQAGDLAFFSNSAGKITHTSICIGDGEIIHASGFVKTDELRPEGIWDRSLQKTTHSLSFVNSYFTEC